ncbi:glutaredoxin [Advenella incenata]|uniref:Glutaredoxin n=1 Tax=Advenella incenata TaxID=267800 RepID=A0A4Q7VRX5_9BURK|nr:glutaredoxin [Advenella incenata]RZT99202.1 glutaredoxin [Advenella incenata]
MARKMQPLRKAVIDRMVMDEHTCPYGLKAKALLRRSGYDVEDHWLTSHEETEAFKEQHAVPTTPQIFIDKRQLKCACVGGSSIVPLGFISLTENPMMIAMAIWMAIVAWGNGGHYGLTPIRQDVQHTNAENKTTLRSTVHCQGSCLARWPLVIIFMHS